MKQTKGQRRSLLWTMNSFSAISKLLSKRERHRPATAAAVPADRVVAIARRRPGARTKAGRILSPGESPQRADLALVEIEGRELEPGETRRRASSPAVCCSTCSGSTRWPWKSRTRAFAVCGRGERGVRRRTASWHCNAARSSPISCVIALERVCYSQWRLVTSSPLVRAPLDIGVRTALGVAGVGVRCETAALKSENLSPFLTGAQDDRRSQFPTHHLG